MKKIKDILKWLVPKIAGGAVLVLGWIEKNERLPNCTTDYIVIIAGVGLIFASNGLPKKEN